jgi:hypothetical protein
MPKVRPRSAFVAPCIPTRSVKPPAGPDRVHEIKHDGYRLQVRRDGDVVRLFTRKGYDWSGRYPVWIVPEAFRDINGAVRYPALTAVGHLWSAACRLFLATMFMSPAPVPRR